jgi:hypothetical protein
LPGDCRLLQFFEVPFDKWRDIDLYALENAYLESGWDVARTAVVLMARLRNLPNFWDGFRRPAALGFRVLLLMKRLQSRGVGLAKRRAQFAAMRVLLDLDRLDRACDLRRVDAAVLAAEELGQVPMKQSAKQLNVGDPNGLKGYFKFLAVKHPKSCCHYK